MANIATRGTRQASIVSPFLFNIFIDGLLNELSKANVGQRVGDHKYNSLAYDINETKSNSIVF